MAKTNNLKEVPFGPHSKWMDVGGKNQLVTVPAMLSFTYGTPERPSKGVTYHPNEPFSTTLWLVELERGRSAARFWWQDEAGVLYPMFGQGIVELLQNVTLDRGKVTGTWIAVKRGANYGIERYEEKND